MDELPQALADKIRAQILRDTQPVKPLMSIRAHSVLFAAIFASVAIVFAAVSGFKGLHVLPGMAAAQMLALLVLLAVWCGVMAARSMRPAAGPLYSWMSALVAVAAYEVLVMGLFRDHSTAPQFLHNGIVCLAFGVGCGAVAALLIWFVMRRGLMVNPVGAGAILGLIGGISGLAALTMHCPILTMPHTAVWHAAVVVVCTGLGALAGRLRAI